MACIIHIEAGCLIWKGEYIPTDVVMIAPMKHNQSHRKCKSSFLPYKSNLEDIIIYAPLLVAKSVSSGPSRSYTATVFIMRSRRPQRKTGKRPFTIQKSVFVLLGYIGHFQLLALFSQFITLFFVLACFCYCGYHVNILNFYPLNSINF